MALADTGNAIGAVTQLLNDRLSENKIPHCTNNEEVSVTVGRPEPPSNGSSNNCRLNIFLYEAIFDPQLKNVSLDEGQPAPLWLSLKYLLTAFDEGGESDSVEAHKILGNGIQILQKLSYLTLNATSLPALNDNPDVLKITFNEASVDLLSKLMQGTDEKYRFSISFEVRPIMIAPEQPSSYSLLVGVNYEIPPPDPDHFPGEKGIKIEVLPSLGANIDSIDPQKFEVGDTVTIHGSSLNLSNLSVCLGSLLLPVTSQRPDELKFLVDETIATGSTTSAGSQAISVVQTLSTGRERSSNLLVGGLLPVVNSAAYDAGPQSIDLTGVFLGSDTDDILLALYQEGTTVAVFDTVSATDPNQTILSMDLSANVPPAGEYRVILRVNGQQAKNSPEITIV